MRVLVAILAALCTVGLACTDTPAAPEGGAEPSMPGTAGEVAVTCLADGPTLVSATEVLAQPDGVHIHLTNMLDEPASVNGLNLDPDLGAGERRELVSRTAPGVLDLACWPLSERGGGLPRPTPLEVLDPEGMWTSAELTCDGAGRFWQIADFAEPAPVPVVPSLEEARGLIGGLRPSDEVAHAGYPGSPDSVIVIRDGDVIASVAYVSASGRYQTKEANGCSDTGLRL